VRFEVLTASSMKMRVFWDIAPCSLAGVERRFRRLKFQSTPVRLHSAICQKTLIFIKIVVGWGPLHSRGLGKITPLALLLWAPLHLTVLNPMIESLSKQTPIPLSSKKTHTSNVTASCVELPCQIWIAFMNISRSYKQTKQNRGENL
jgi:hypothetical protein